MKRRFDTYRTDGDPDRRGYLRDRARALHRIDQGIWAWLLVGAAGLLLAAVLIARFAAQPAPGRVDTCTADACRLQLPPTAPIGCS